MINFLSVKNFKSIKQLECKFPHFAALVGKNAAGKSNILQSIAVLKELVSGDVIDAVLGKRVLVPAEVFNKDTSEKVSTISIEISDKEETSYLLEISFQLMNGNVPANFVISYEKLEVSRGGNKIKIYERKEGQIEDSAGNPMIITADSKRLFISLFTNSEAQTVRDLFKNFQIPDPQLMDSRDTIVGIDEKNLAGLLIQLRHNEAQLYSEFEKIAKKLLPTFSSITELTQKIDSTSTPTDEEQYFILFEEKHLRGQLSVKLLSAGDVRTLYIIAVAIGMKEHSTLILEEIENGIHQKRIEGIIEHLESISHIKKIQILFTTHSERVINRLPAHGVLYVENDLSNGTRITPLDNNVQTLSHIQEVLNMGGSLSEYINVNLNK